MSDQIPSDEQLIDRIVEDDKGAFRLLFNKYYQTLLSTAINMLKDVSTAKDATQEVFLTIWKNRATFEMPDSLPGYLKRAVINRSLNQIKSRKAVVEDSKIVDMQSSSPQANETLAAKDLKEVMHTALERLPDRCRLIFVMRRLEGLSLKEIANQLEISPKTVENQITKALKALKDAVKSYDEENSS